MVRNECLWSDFQGTAQVEYLVILCTVAVGFVSATAVLGPALISYCSAISFVLSLPVP